ncbi:MAG: DUF971 domain-containing protein [Candidatus Marinimicrobia bacterium]|nr:DUF971 domain-containing protein [Candidatus Neomarinimicrobiota bacterium]MCF7850060.1 DUF971 domain-containing protein [Candidatus Neomarinimicrobiota bacterium]MCF7904720.1 DUF971 domain-containing protein [Candidatus Neomarinimicrobiota bacterium]
MKIKEIKQFPVGIAIRWEDDVEMFIDLHKLRDACPCANCSGESDLFGNKTFGLPMLKSEKTYQLDSFRWVGHYALQFVWEDRHDSGIYTLDLLRKLGTEEDENE